VCGLTSKLRNVHSFDQVNSQFKTRTKHSCFTGFQNSARTDLNKFETHTRAQRKLQTLWASLQRMANSFGELITNNIHEGERKKLDVEVTCGHEKDHEKLHAYRRSRGRYSFTDAINRAKTSCANC
jgi:hypothetical protein